MRNKWIAGICLLLPALPAPADSLKGEILVTSNYVWRGLTLSEDSPSLMGGFAYAHKKGWFAAAHVANVRVDDTPEQEALVRAGLRRPAGAWDLEAGAVLYEYLRGDRYDPATGSLTPGSSNKNDFVELFLGVLGEHFRFHYYRSEDYLGKGHLSNYYDFNYDVALSGSAKLILHYGYTDSQSILDHSSQLSDTAFGVTKGPLTFLITNLDDNEDGMQSRNPRFVFSWREEADF